MKPLQLFAAVFLFAVAVVLPKAVYAHAILLSSSPEANQQLDESPSEVAVNFNENVGPIFFRVLNTKGEEVGDPGDPRVEGNSMLMTLGDTLPNGTYILTYRVVSADTHPVGASFVFSVGEPITDTSSMDMSAESAQSGWWLPVATNRFILYTSVLFGVGAAMFLILMDTPQTVTKSAYNIGRFAAAVSMVAYFASIGMGGAEMVMGGPAALLSLNSWTTGLGTTLGPSAALGIPGALLLFLAFRSAESQSTGLLLVGSLLVVGSFLVTGHAATAPPVWIMAPMVAAHILCGGFWLAALLPLSKSTKLPDIAEAGAVMTQFSGRAVMTVGLLFVSGVVITWFQVESIMAMIETDYGFRLSLKIGLFLALLGIAYYNKSVLTPALEKAEADGGAKMRRSIRLELLLMAAILIAAVSLTLVTPPRALSDQAGNMGSNMSGGMSMGGEGFSTVVEQQGYSMKIEVTPAKTGENMAMLTFTDADGKPVDMLRIETDWSLPAAGLEGIGKVPEKMAPGMYHLMFNDLIIPGDWEVRVGVFVTDFDKYNFRTSVPIK